MSTLLIELAGPLQSWGSSSRFATRATELAPTKSGVIGLLAAALGLERTSSLERFSSLYFGVRIDQPGRVDRDFQTARTLDGKTSMPLSNRFYLSDAVFLVGLETEDDAFLRSLKEAFAQPVFPLYLGRRAFPPAGPIWTAVVDHPLQTAFEETPWKASKRYQLDQPHQHVRLETVIDAPAGAVAAETLRDEPISFDPRRREYGWRDIVRGDVQVPNVHYVPRERPPGNPTSSAGASHPHDPLELLPEGS